MTLFQENVITRAELSHLRRLTATRSLFRQVTHWGRLAMLAGWAAVVLFILLKLPQGRPGVLLWEEIAPLVILLMTGTFILHFITVYRSLMLASEATMRERRARTWETLLLTGINTRQLVMGKWWAALRVLWLDFLLLAFLRAGAVIALGVAFDFDRFMPAPVLPQADRIALVVALSIAFTLANGIFSAAAGVVGGLITTRSDGVALPAAEVIRVCSLLIPMLAILGLFLHFLSTRPEASGDALQPLLYFTLCLLDNGLLVPAALLNPLTADPGMFLLAAVGAVLFYPVMTGLLLTAGQYAARRQGILPPAKGQSAS